MTTTYNTQRLAKAVFAGNTQVVKEIIESGDFNHDILSDVFKGLGLDPEEEGRYEDTTPIPPIPLYYISLCNKIYLDGSWSDEFQPIADRNLKSCAELLNYWQSIGYDVSTPIDFSKYRKFCAHFVGTFEELMDGDMDTLLKKGYNKDEANLAYAIYTYDKATIFDLLEKRVNPNVLISGECNADQCTDMEGMRGYDIICDSLSDPFIIDSVDIYYQLTDIDKMYPVQVGDLRSLFCAAAYQEILNKIEELNIPLSED